VSEGPSTERVKQEARARLAARFDDLLELSHRLHRHPELGLQEVKAARWVAEAARAAAGARVQVGLGSLPTAVRAEAGHGDLVLTLCAEYDALPSIGHACGHNVIAAAALGAFHALAPLADQLGVTVRLLGTPAEETVGGKITLLEQGDFDGTHAAMMIHPGDYDEAAMRPYACTGFLARYEGVSAHASARPWEAANAQDALVVAMTALGLARQQLRPHQQIHGYTRGAGDSPNVVPGWAEAEFMVRGDSMESLDQVTAVLRRCLNAGAVASGTELVLEQVGATYASLRSDEAVADLFGVNAAALGRNMRPAGAMGGSTDMGNVSQRFPSIHPMLALGDPCPPMHSPEFAAAAASPAGDRAVWDGSLAMANTCIDLALDPHQRARLLQP
jgi:amidohydrolase